MRFIADLHIHSKHSRATSKDMCPEGLFRWAQIKGIGVIGTGDFTHPLWMEELKENLEPASSGLYRLKRRYEPPDVPSSCKADVFFMLTAEISSIYSKNGRVRKVHSILLAPGFKEAEAINKRLSGIGNLSADGRPILGLDAKRLLEIVLDASPEAMVIPAHAWTPHFSVLGSNSGFDSLHECFEELTPHIHAIETGLSSDPPMNRRLLSLNSITLVSNSDAHSPPKIGREANIFDTDISYHGITNAIKTGQGFGGTIEFFPEEGKYHYDGHRLCGVSMPPQETIKHKYICPACGKRLTVGVMHRVEKLADAPAPIAAGAVPPFYSIIPFAEVLAEVFDAGVNTKKVQKEYFRLIEALGNEFKILLDVPLSGIRDAASPEIRDRLKEAVEKMRSGDVHISPGFDGQYGTIKIF